MSRSELRNGIPKHRDERRELHRALLALVEVNAVEGPGREARLGVDELGVRAHAEQADGRQRDGAGEHLVRIRIRIMVRARVRVRVKDEGEGGR